MKTNTRRLAAFAVARWISSHERPENLLPEGPDRAFVQDLVYVTVRRFRPLRRVLGELVKTWPKGEMEALLLVGGAQILYMPDVPDFAAVNETVEAAKACPNKAIAKVVNGVLRNLLRRREEFEKLLAAAPLAERESYPNAIVDRWVARYGEEGAEKLAAWHNAPAETWLARKPDANGEGAFEKLARGKKVTDESGYAEGDFIVQNPATAGAVKLLDVRPGQRVLDFCAAPGGKTVQIAWRLGADAGKLVAQEVNPKRLRTLQSTLKRCKLDAVQAVSAVDEKDAGAFDRVLVDAPCSNTGVLRRRPDARWNWTKEKLSELVTLQAEILDRAAAFCAPGGVLVYSTCSNEPEENGEQAAAFLARHPGWREVARTEFVPFETDHDGAFAVAFERM